ncbi:hypothetical protein OUZ56_017935 [Daphnia magna]|uniref:Uncharacterized protein n=1 Tax=Daphnia magna TaxID=35525 RepID=A0ABR0ATV3_9CRUS|nr:hypothetical protein OUZ56_017935 [Daphnia magna]
MTKALNAPIASDLLLTKKNKQIIFGRLICSARGAVLADFRGHVLSTAIVAAENKKSRKRLNVDAQLAVFNIESVGTPFSAAFEAEAPRVEWAEKIDVSTPASSRTFLSHCPIVEPFTSLCGLTEPTNRFAFSPCLRKGNCCFNVSSVAATGQMIASSKRTIFRENSGPFLWDFLSLDRLKSRPLSEQFIDDKLIAANSETRNIVTKAKSIAVLRDS